MFRSLKKGGHSILSRITFKRFVILLIIFILALPILKSVFWDDIGSPAPLGEYEYSFIRGNDLSENRVLQLPINGVILTESTSVAGPFDFLEEGVTYGYALKETLRRAADDDSIKAVLLTVNSPGGTIPGSKAISDGIEYYREKTGNPVYAHIRDVGASGAYWAAVATDRVYVDTGSIVGSIGVLMGPFVYYNNPVEEGSFLGSVTTDGGIEHTYFTGGEFKDTGSPYRRLTPEERDHWQRSIDNEYAVFVAHVARYRKIPTERIVRDIKALPYDSIQGQELGLVDAIASEDTALADLTDRAGLGEDYQVIEEKSKGDFLTDLLSAFSQQKPPTAGRVCMLCNAPLFLYDRTYSIYRE